MGLSHGVSRLLLFSSEPEPPRPRAVASSSRFNRIRSSDQRKHSTGQARGIFPKPMQTQNQPENVELRIRSMRVIWSALILNIGFFFVLTLFAKRPEDVQPNSMLSLTMIVIAASTTLVSLLIKGKLLTKAIDQSQVQQVQQAYVVAWAVTEVAALLGLLDYFMTADRYYYFFFLISLCGQLLHFPRSEHVVNASFRPSL